jgi:hypothetical protein
MSSALPVQSFNQTPLTQETISPSPNVHREEISQAERVQSLMENKQSQVPNDPPDINPQPGVVIRKLTEHIQKVCLVENYQRGLVENYQKAPDDLPYDVVKPEMVVGDESSLDEHFNVTENDQRAPDDIRVAPTKYSLPEMVVGDDTENDTISRTSNIYQNAYTDRNEHDDYNFM